MISLKLLVKNLMALLEPRSVVGIKKLLIDARGVSLGNTPMRGEFLQAHLSHPMDGYPHFTTLDKAQTIGIYAASVSPHGLIEFSTLWAAKTQLSNAQKLDDPQRNFWKDLVVFPYHQGV